MRLSNMLVPLLSATSVGLVSAASTPEPQTAEIDLPKNLIVARYFGNDRFIGAGAILYGIGRCINFAPFEVAASIKVLSKVNCTIYTDIGCQTDKEWHYKLPIIGPTETVFPDSFLGVNENRTRAESYECGMDTAAK